MADGERGGSGEYVGPEKPSVSVPTKYTPRRLATIQVLRGLAALMVVFHHVQDQSEGFRQIVSTQAGQAGVDLFFVISGFVMVYVTHDREQSPGQFLAMRAARIVPVYWFFTLAASLLIVLQPQLFRSNEATVRHVVLSMFFVPHNTVSGGLSPVIKQGWTLNYEAFFYVLFAIAMALSFRRRAGFSVWTLLGLAFIGYWLPLIGYSSTATNFYLNNIILEFAFGMLIAQAYLNGKFERIGPIFSVGLVAIGFIALFACDPLYSSSNRAFTYGLPAAAIVAGAVAFETRSDSFQKPFLQFVGDASYSIYLVHVFPVAMLRVIWPKIGLEMSGAGSFAAFLLAAFALSIAAGAVSYYLVEKTSLKFLRRKIQEFSNRG
jgi:exopolysaccharide production protein ExoZ